MKYPSLLLMGIMFVVGVSIMSLLPFILPGIVVELQAAIVVLIIIPLGIVVVRWYNRRGIKSPKNNNRFKI